MYYKNRLSKKNVTFLMTTLITLFLISFSLCADERKENHFQSDLFASATILASFQKDASGTYAFQGPPPGVYFLWSAKNAMIRHDFLKYDPSIYYVGVGFVTDQSFQYGYSLQVSSFELTPSVGIGLAGGIMNGIGFYQWYVPVSVCGEIVSTPTLTIQVWGQIQNYFLTQSGFTYWMGGKIAANIYYKLTDALHLGFQPVFGGGGSQLLTGLRIGCVFKL